jgi:biopolymer transport protein ExbB
MENNLSQLESNSKNLISWVAPIGCIILGEMLYYFVLGRASNFEDPDNLKGPLNWMGRMYEGGVIVPILIGLFLMVVVFSIERYISIKSANGVGNQATFINKIKLLLETNNIQEAVNACDTQKGALGNVMKAGLASYQRMMQEKTLTKEHKLEIIQKDVEEATGLELPMLEKNMVFLSTITSLSVLIALLGTVLGMIRSFANLGDSGGGAGAIELAKGISEALYNTAVGIATGSLALIMYNVFVTKTESIIHKSEEASVILSNSFVKNAKE